MYLYQLTKLTKISFAYLKITFFLQLGTYT